MAHSARFALPGAARGRRLHSLAPLSLPVLGLAVSSVFGFALTASAQAPAQQFVYTSAPATATSASLTGSQKNGQSGALTSVPGSPFADAHDSGSIAVDALGRFLFLLNPNDGTVSMFQVDSNSGALAEVAGSPFAIPPTINPSIAPSLPASLATEKTGQYLFVGYRNGSVVGDGEVDEFSIDATRQQLVPVPTAATSTVSGPIAMASEPRGNALYAFLGFLDRNGSPPATLNVYSINSVSGQLGLLGSGGGTETARVMAVDPQGRFIYIGWGLNAGFFQGYQISPVDGSLSQPSTPLYSLGPNIFPTQMQIEAAGRYLYMNQSDLQLHMFSIDATSGALTEVSNSPQSVNLGPFVADPMGPYLYTADLRGYQTDPVTGLVTPLAGSPFGGTGAAGNSIAITGTAVQAVSGPVAAFSPSSEPFGDIIVGQSSGSHIVTVVNTGDQSLALNSLAVIGADSSDFAATPACQPPTVLQPNSSCSVSVVFTPSAGGMRQAMLTAVDNAPGSPQSILLTGTGVAATPGVTLVPGSLTFPTIAQGTASPPQSATVTSSGSATLQIFSVVLGGSNPADFTMSSTCSGAFAINANCSIGVTFTPQAAGLRSATITITDNASNSPQALQISGTATSSPPTNPAVSLGTTALSFPEVTQGTISAPQKVTLTSSGGATLHISSVVAGGANPAEFSLTNGCSGAYVVNSTCSLGVSFAPQAPGSHSARLTITDDAPNSPQSITLNGTAGPAFTLEAGSNAGSTSATVTAGQTATYNLQLTPGPGFTGSVSFTCTGAPSSATCAAPSVLVRNGNPVSFTVSVATSAAGSITPTSIFWRRLPIGGIRFTPTVFAALLALGLMSLLLARIRFGGFAVRTLGPTAFLAGAFLAGCLSIAMVSGCGGGSGGSSPAPQVVVPQGSFTLTVTGTPATSGGQVLASLPPIQLSLTIK
jgi:6-phosphogluconolactonase (cycloisomerase 2 family)